MGERGGNARTLSAFSSMHSAGETWRVVLSSISTAPPSGGVSRQSVTQSGTYRRSVCTASSKLSNDSTLQIIVHVALELAQPTSIAGAHSRGGV